MTEIRVLHAPDSVAFACQVAAALAAGGYSVIRAGSGEGPTRAGDTTLVIWSRGMFAAERALDEARAALARRRLVPVAIGKIEPPASFAHLTPIDLSGWSGGREDARWRFALEEIALALKTPAAAASAELYCDEEAEAPAGPPPTAYIVPMRTIAAGAAGLAALAVAAIVAAALAGRGGQSADPAVVAAVSPRAASPASLPPASLAPAEAPRRQAPPEPAEAVGTDDAAPVTAPPVQPVLRDAPIDVAAIPEVEEPAIEDAARDLAPTALAEAVTDAVPAPAPEATNLPQDPAAALAALAPPPPPADDFLGVVFRDCADCPDMAEIPAGPQGAAPARLASTGAVDTAPVSGFAVSRREVTFAEWDACVAAGGCQGHRPDDAGFGRGARPVINVSHADARAYVAWLSSKTGRRYRLPTEAEWEHAALGGARAPSASSAAISPAAANYAGALRSNGGNSFSIRMSLPAGSYPANVFGLYDLHGNVWEWVEDCWDPSCDARVVKGGGYDSGLSELAAENRAGQQDRARDPAVGFRVARDLD